MRTATLTVSRGILSTHCSGHFTLPPAPHCPLLHTACSICSTLPIACPPPHYLLPAVFVLTLSWFYHSLPVGLQSEARQRDSDTSRPVDWSLPAWHRPLPGPGRAASTWPQGHMFSHMFLKSYKGKIVSSQSIKITFYFHWNDSACRMALEWLQILSTLPRGSWVEDTLNFDWVGD